MKTVESLIYQGVTLTILVTIEEVPDAEKDKAFVEYFINGYQVKDWGKIKAVYQQIFTAMADEECNKLSAVKWSY